MGSQHEGDAPEDGIRGLTLLKQGAEARVFETTFMGRRAVVKERFCKKYRHPSLDTKLSQKRLYGEARCMTKARKLGVRTPALFAVDAVTRSITFEFVTGSSVKDILLQSGFPTPGGELERIAAQIGVSIARIHDGGLIHGDLTTSNMLIHSGELVMIDFGLSYTSTFPEDKAVDLYVLERAFLSLHSTNGDMMGLVLAAYKKASRFWSSTLNKLAQVQMRGRKRAMLG
ncbi:EKC/KEOPS complex subunit bud32 [Selaginella moellendorffii]|uniref:EKC/KEOPS complex subunit bud32 n=1 Tax=Selaginella moellendorffii TaxID=88036 RepID=UPI000D1CAD32|nr:EKC/KEOPS complex subunit bud32 [Selaginella moellendorffii]|eukprot:XP_024535299.1 EKC/KEOPS complex subunit bud32 [Selaginella moellendorffii]